MRYVLFSAPAAALVAVTLVASTAYAQSGVGAAPKGDAKTVASRIIKYNFPSCKAVVSATRSADGSIRARCDSTDFMVFTIFNSKEGKATELAMNCTAAKKHLNVDC
ncbi:MAG: hypothetical protein EOP24_31875 [Hyphomicrobiales bacterium]|nr:MAG: hypothetical protein EOP24_31875 [Hyphomicrobiales bacterium]